MDTTLKVRVKYIRPEQDKDIPLPKRMSPKAAGIDLFAAIAGPVELPPLSIAKIPTGIALELPEGHEGQVRPRSGLAAKYGITLLNSPGTIDQDYRGEIQVILINLGEKPFTVKRGMRVAQLVVAPVTLCEVIEAKELEDTSRAGGGFGSTGL
ncbi:MAG: dUTP diphosphatase [Deltaproteobacteria bacterium]|nr:dUTP diphosphatase [Deltaproteobacteria bacterium]